jgi:hypothetical protein
VASWLKRKTKEAQGRLKKAREIGGGLHSTLEGQHDVGGAPAPTPLAALLSFAITL